MSVRASSLDTAQKRFEFMRFKTTKRNYFKVHSNPATTTMAMRMLKQTLVFLSLLLILLDVIVAAKEEEECSPQDDTCNTTTTTTTNKNHRIVVPDDCRLVYYNNHHQDDESFSSSLSSSWGVYSLTSRSKATSVFGNFGDVVIQWTGPLPRNSPMNWLEYSWPGQETGGQF